MDFMDSGFSNEGIHLTIPDSVRLELLTSGILGNEPCQTTHALPATS